MHFVSFFFDVAARGWKAREKFVNANKWTIGGYWALAKMMRHQVFTQVAGGPRVPARDDPLDRDSKSLHFLALSKYCLGGWCGFFGLIVPPICV